MTENKPSERGSQEKRGARVLKWLAPGLGVKRWLIPILLGTTLIGVGMAVVILDVYRKAPNTWWLPYFDMFSLRDLARPVRAFIFAILGTLLVLTGIYGLNRSLLAPFQKPGKFVLDEVAIHRRRERGPRIAAIGGGHGLAMVLRGLKEYTYNITAVVTVADDGGSSGRIRKTLGILPPGDIRNCLAALSNDEALLAQLFQYRFPSMDESLQGHSFGNLFIFALSEIMGSFEEAIAESGRVLAVHGRVLPSTLHDVRLVADVALSHVHSEVRIEGESNIPEFPGKVSRVWLEPNNPPAYPQIIQALLGAELIVIGPGSLYTSILPNLLVPDITEAIRASRALKIYVCNLATQPGETDGYSTGDHVQVIMDHVGEGLFDIVVVNNQMNIQLPEGSDWVLTEPDFGDRYPTFAADLIDEDHPGQHNAKKLAKVLIDLLQEKTGPLVE